MSRKIILPTEEICKRYRSGETEQALAKAYGVSRPVIFKQLQVGNVTRRTPAEVRLLSASQFTPEQRRARAKAAHDAKRGKAPTFEQQCEAAKTREERQLNVSPAEQLLQLWLAERGINAIPQRAIGPYNADLCFMNTIIEIYGGGWHGTPERCAKDADRRLYLLAKGWNMIIIWVDRRRGWTLSPKVIDYIVSFAQYNYTGVTRVLNGKGDQFAIGSFWYRKTTGG